MALIVQKYGGTSVADPERIHAVADNVAFAKKRGNDVIVVVRLPKDLRDAIKACADREDRSVASLMRVAAREYLDRAAAS